MVDSPTLFHKKHYFVTTPVFEGPLDLLLHLIERAELDITRLALAQVTEQYLEYLHALEDRHPDEVSAFLVIAARLVQIKSEVLLPRPVVREPGEEDPGEELVRQLLIYKRFKQVANYLAAREDSDLRTYLRLAPASHLSPPLDLGELGLEDLVSAARAIFMPLDERAPLGDVVTAPRITIRQKIHLINSRLHQNDRINFSELLSPNPTIIEVIITFIAMLELIKRQLISCRQERLFDEIIIENRGISDETEYFELEFDE